MIQEAQTYLDKAFLDTVDAFLDSRTRDTDTVWTNTHNIPVLSMEFQMYVMRISTPNYEKPIQVGAACIPGSWYMS